jgi:Ran GTPase-activating protein (RanGAP) involved in mRNA processing and transport
VASVLRGAALAGDAELVVLRGEALRGLALGSRLAQLFAHRPGSVGELRLRDARLGDDEAQALLSALGAWDPERPFKLKALELTACELFVDPRTALLLQQALKVSLSLRELSLARNPLGDAGARLLASVLQPSGALFCPLVALDLRRCAIGPAGGAALCDALAGNEVLRSLNLTGNLFCDAATGAPALGRLLAGAAATAGLGLASLVCGDCALRSADSVGVVLAGLRANQSLVHLVLPSNELGDGAGGHLAAALAARPALATLQLSGCGLGDATARQLAAPLAHPRCGLQVLHLGHNAVGNAGAGALGRALESNGALRELVLNDNAIGPSGLAAIFTPLRANGSLALLNLAGNAFGPTDRAARSLSLCLRYNGEANHIRHQGQTCCVKR